MGKREKLQRLKQKTRILGQRLADQHVNLAVTGLSRSGKTAFITALVNQLLEAKSGARLPFWSVLQEGRLVGVRRDVQPDSTLARFAYEEGIQRLSQTPAQWPASTNGVSQIRLLIKYRHGSGLRRVLSEHSTLTLDITDYPGEWLLDLPLLELSYAQWCEQCWQNFSDPLFVPIVAQFSEATAQLDLSAPADEMVLAELSESFSTCLLEAKNAGYQLIQPGRFVLPGELKGAPVLQFFPVKPQDLGAAEVNSGSTLELLEKRFEDYKSLVVKPFYKQHFRHFDRQIVLVDCLSALNRGAYSFYNLQKAINWLLGSFHYGHSNVLKRLFSPNIDRLIFAASKADHVTPDQQANLVKLLESMVHEARQHIQFEGVETESTAFAAVRASQALEAQIDGQHQQVIRGLEAGGESRLLYPGDVPTECPAADFWQQQGFDFPQFQPPSLALNNALPHIRLDQILEFVLGDKLR